MANLNTRLESEGAEFLVLGTLLIEGIPAYKTYTNYPGYDVIAVNPASGKSCRIQVKCRWATDFNRTFLIKNLACDFVVMVALNRGYRYYKKARAKSSDDMGRRAPQMYVFPIRVVKKAVDPTSNWGRCSLGRIKNVENYIDDWEPIREFLGATS